MSKSISIFVSYSHINQKSAIQLIELLSEQLKASKNYDYHIWFDKQLNVGEVWKNKICETINSCDLGLLLVSPSFLSSKFILEHELPKFTGENVISSVPVMLQPIDFERHNLRGLEERQIFTLDGKAFYKCKSKNKYEFSFELFKSIEEKLAAKSR